MTVVVLNSLFVTYFFCLGNAFFECVICKVTHSRLCQMVARGGIEPPTQGFSIILPHRFDYRFQTVVPANKNVAHNMCL